MFSVLLDFTAQLTNKFNNGSSINHSKLINVEPEIRYQVSGIRYLPSTIRKTKIRCIPADT